MMNHNRTQSKRLPTLAWVALLALLAGAAASWLFHTVGGQKTPPTLQAATALWEQSRPLADFSLVDQNGLPFTNKRLQGQWSFLYFGYIHCPDVCPTTLATLNKAFNLIAKNRDQQNTQIIFVSVDPERDGAEQLKSYVEYFNPQFIGLTGKPAELDGLTSNLGIVHAKIANTADPTNYLVDHSASVLLVDPKGRLTALFGAPQQAKTLADDFHRLRRYYEAG
jgi:protein SCO1/2